MANRNRGLHLAVDSKNLVGTEGGREEKQKFLMLSKLWKSLKMLSLHRQVAGPNTKLTPHPLYLCLPLSLIHHHKLSNYWNCILCISSLLNGSTSNKQTEKKWTRRQEQVTVILGSFNSRRFFDIFQLLLLTNVSSHWNRKVINVLENI